MKEYQKMADSEKTDMTVEAAQPLNDVQNALAKFEAERMTRRQALAKVGLRFGAAAVALLSVDELARKAGGVLQSNARGNKVVEQVAQEMQKAGVVNALATRSCINNANVKNGCIADCDKQYATCSQGDCDSVRDGCYKGCGNFYCRQCALLGCNCGC